MMSEERIAVVGLGYVGLPVAWHFAKHFSGVVGYDINAHKVDRLRRGEDTTRQVTREELIEVRIRFTFDARDLADRSMVIMTVPTPIDDLKKPDLSSILAATKTVAGAIRSGTVVVYESTVYPGVTEEICGPLIEEISGMKAGRDFFLGYSPERINPGDREHTFDKVCKIVSADRPETLERIAAVYGRAVQAPLHRAPSIRVAEAAKVIENTQRDINIALMNELALIFDRMGIRTSDVLQAAGTKWNFLPFRPGLVGGHCIGVDPYYLTSKAEQLGYHPQVILAGRRINDGLGTFVAQRTVKLLVSTGVKVKEARALVMGLTFKENVPDVRNSRVPDIVRELAEFGVSVDVADPVADPGEAAGEYGFPVHRTPPAAKYDAVILAVAHREIVDAGIDRISALLKSPGVFVDVKSVSNAGAMPRGVAYWSL